MNNVITKQQSDAFWQIKAFAIFTVFFAHMPAHEINGTSYMIDVFDTVGMLGVPLFMMLSGYFNYTSKFSLKKTIRSLFVPLLIWGTICYILHIIKTPTETPIIDWIKFVGGSKSIFYFVPMLFCCIVLSHYVNSWILLLLGIATQALTTYSQLIPYNEIWTFNLNPFIFMASFTTGRLFRKYDCLGKYKNWWMPLSVLVMILFLALKGQPDYYSPFTVIFTGSLLVFLYGVFMRFSVSWINYIGKISFVIYLCHIQIAGAVQAIWKPLWGSYLEPVKIFVAFAIVVLFCLGIQLIIERAIKKPELLRLLGYR